MNELKRYLPEKVFDKIQQLDFKNKEHLYIICDMIYRISIYRNISDYKNNYIDIPTTYFTDIIVNKKYYSKAKKCLLDNKIIISDGIYSKNKGKALGYKFNDHLLSKLISVKINKRTLTKRIINNKNSRNNLVNEKLHKYRNYYLNTFKIDFEKALQHLDNWYLNSKESYIEAINKYNHIFISISAINDGDLYFNKNKTNGRVDTNLTSLKSEYKQFIIPNNLTPSYVGQNEPKTIEISPKTDVGQNSFGDGLWQVDIVNSQPFILSTYLNYLYSSYVGQNLEESVDFLEKNNVVRNENTNVVRINEQELLKYNSWTGGGIFYEMFEKEYFRKTSNVLTRKEIKELMFCIFYSKNGSYTKQKNIFKSIFPTINDFIENEKKIKHNGFAIKLQKIESKICIDIICQELDKEEIKYYTIHDAWLIKKEDITKTKEIIINMFYKHLHIRPELKIEKIQKDEL